MTGVILIARHGVSVCVCVILTAGLGVSVCVCVILTAGLGVSVCVCVILTAGHGVSVCVCVILTAGRGVAGGSLLLQQFVDLLLQLFLECHELFILFALADLLIFNTFLYSLQRLTVKGNDSRKTIIRALIININL